MNEFDRASDDWDLQAIVKGQTTSTNTMAMQNSYAWFDQSFPLEDCEILQESYVKILNELEELICKPFQKGIPADSPPKTVDNDMVGSVDGYAKSPIVKARKEEMTMSGSSRRRKNKHKIKYVQQAAGDRLSLDKWNWRKYGEKAIKNSHYPRSYYRCSTSGSCLARKQVEQSNNDPGTFLVTYIDEHNHPYPTRSHSQAGHNSRRPPSASRNVLFTTISQ